MTRDTTLEETYHDNCLYIIVYIYNSLEYCNIMHIIQTHKISSLIEKTSLTNLGIVTSSVYNDVAVF